MSKMAWQGENHVVPKAYKCGYCSREVGPDRGISANQHGRPVYLYFCSFCGQPTFFDFQGKQYPGARFGNPVAYLPKDIEQLYGEARASVSVQAYTPAVLACRKVLMNVAVGLGAKPGEPFIKYVEFLATNGYVPPNGKHWVNHIRTKSNEANHEIVLMSQAEAEKLIIFVEMMLKFIYELPQTVPMPTAIAP